MKVHRNLCACEADDISCVWSLLIAVLVFVHI